MDPIEQNNDRLNHSEDTRLSVGTSLRSTPLIQGQRTQPLRCGVLGSGFTPSAEFEQAAADHLHKVRELGAACIKLVGRSGELAKAISEIKYQGSRVTTYEVDCLAGILTECPELESTPFINAITGIYDKERHALYLEKIVSTKIPAQERTQIIEDLQSINQSLPLLTNYSIEGEPLWQRITSHLEKHDLVLRDGKPLLPVHVSSEARKAAIAPADIQRSRTERFNQRDLAVCAMYSKLVEILNDHDQKPALVLEASLTTPIHYDPKKRVLRISPALFSLTEEELASIIRFAKKYQLIKADGVSPDRIANDRSFAIEFAYDLLTAPSPRVSVNFVKCIQSALTKFDESFIDNQPFLAQLFRSICQVGSDPSFSHSLPSIRSLRLKQVCTELEGHIAKLQKRKNSNKQLPEILTRLVKDLSTPAFSQRLTNASSSELLRIKLRVDGIITDLRDKNINKSSPLLKTLLFASKACTVPKFKSADNSTPAERILLAQKRYEGIIDRIAETAPEFWRAFSLEKGDFLATLSTGVADIAELCKSTPNSNILGALAALSEDPKRLLTVRSERTPIRADRYRHKSRLKFSPARFELELLKLDPSNAAIPIEIKTISPLLQGITEQETGSEKNLLSRALASQLLVREWLGECVKVIKLGGHSATFKGCEIKALTSAYALSLGRPDLGDPELIARYTREPQLLSYAKAILLERLFVDPLSPPPYNNCISPLAKAAVRLARNELNNILYKLLDSGLINLGHFSDQDQVHIDRTRYILSQWQSKMRIEREVEQFERVNFINPSNNSEAIGAYLSLVSENLLPRTARLLPFCRQLLSTRGFRLLRAELVSEDLVVEGKCWRIVLQQVAQHALNQNAIQEERIAVRAALANVHLLNLSGRKIAAQMFLTYLRIGGNDFSPELLAAWITLLSTERQVQQGLVTEQTAVQRLEQAPAEYGIRLAQKWINTPEKILQLLESELDQPTKTFLLKRCSSEVIERALEGLDTDRVRKYFEDFSLIEALRITKNAMDPHARRAFTQREVYESSIRDLPPSVESLESEEELPNYFAILGIPRQASQAIITKSYRMLALVYHPDLFTRESASSRENAQERTRQLAEAYEVLADDELSKNYKNAIPNYSSYYPKSPWYLSLPKTSDL